MYVMISERYLIDILMFCETLFANNLYWYIQFYVESLLYHRVLMENDKTSMQWECLQRVQWAQTPNFHDKSIFYIHVSLNITLDVNGASATFRKVILKIFNGSDWYASIQYTAVILVASEVVSNWHGYED